MHRALCSEYFDDYDTQLIVSAIIVALLSSTISERIKKSAYLLADGEVS